MVRRLVLAPPARAAMLVGDAPKDVASERSVRQYRSGMSSNGPALTRASRAGGTFRDTIVDAPLRNSRQLLRVAAPTLRLILPIPDDEVPVRVRVLVAAIIAALPWIILGIWAPGEAGDVALIVFTMLVGATYFAYAVAFVWVHRQSPRTHRQPGVVLTQVLSATSYVEGWFALLYYVVSADSAAPAFDPRLSRIDAAYFTISTATTTGVADLHPVSGFARLLISVQIILSLFLIVTAAAIAFPMLSRAPVPAADDDDTCRQNDRMLTAPPVDAEVNCPTGPGHYSAPIRVS
ncbi:MAG: two pore domain potassium channel family protein [Mycobacteriaceae bacterium]|nr:two pore domain potassium channel family protein [Mycobacteriaceae bacterium]